MTSLEAEQGGPLSGYDPVVLSELKAEAERGEGQLGWGRTREAQGGARCLTLWSGGCPRLEQASLNCGSDGRPTIPRSR